MQQIFANGQGGKHRDTEQAARWRWTSTQIAASLVATGFVARRSFALIHSEDEVARTFREMNRAEAKRTMP